MDIGKWRGRLSTALGIAFRFLPMDKKQILFYSCLNQYNDNPKYIAEKLHELSPSLRFVWATGNLDVTEDIPDYFIKVKYDSVAYHYMKARSKVLVDNADGAYSGFATGRAYKRRRLVIKPNQVNISTGHGFPLKISGAAYKPFHGQYSENDYFTSSTLLAMGSVLEQNIHEQITNHQVPSKLLGNARADILFSVTEEKRSKLRKKLGFPQDKKVVLYAPTYRDDIEWAGIKQMEMLNVDKLLESFSESCGGEWILALRFHQIARQRMKTRTCMVANFIDANRFGDMMEYLVASDAVITDYSSTMFDCAIGRIPCVLYTPDWEQYQLDRGLYVNLLETPFPRANKADELYEIIRKFNRKSYEGKCAQYLKEIGDVNDGNASAKTTALILNLLG